MAFEAMVPGHDFTIWLHRAAVGQVQISSGDSLMLLA
jgi:hypothetical protein